MVYLEAYHGVTNILEVVRKLVSVVNMVRSHPPVKYCIFVNNIWQAH